MKIKLDIECTPEELRGFFGLPDVRGMQEQLLKEVEAQMRAGIKALDSDNAKKISKLIRDQFKTVKPLIQGESVRVVSKSKDELQDVMKFLREREDLDVPLVFNNYR